MKTIKLPKTDQQSRNGKQSQSGVSMVRDLWWKELTMMKCEAAIRCQEEVC